MKIRIVKKKKLDEISAMGTGMVVGAPREEMEEQKEELDELYSTSGAMMGAGSGQIPHERSPKGHKRYVRIRFTRQGLQNFKPSPYFRSQDQQLGERIENVDGKFVVYPEKGGKRLGTHDTRKEAEKQLAAIEISKQKKG